MLYRFQLSTTPKSLLLPLMVVVAIGGSVALAIWANVALGIVALVISGFLGYHVLRLFVNTLKSNVQTTDDELICATPMGKETRIEWSRVSHAGSFTSYEGDRDLFVYAEQDDRLLAIPTQYENIEGLEEDIQEHIDVEPLNLTGDESEDLADVLRDMLAPEEEIIDDE